MKRKMRTTREPSCGPSIIGIWLRVVSGEGKGDGRDLLEPRRRRMNSQMGPPKVGK